MFPLLSVVGSSSWPQLTALGKRACPECGGEMEWNAARQVLACPYCGFIPKEQPLRAQDASAAPARELDLERALAEVADEKRGYGLTTVKVKCQSCQAITVFAAGRVAQRCDFCGSPAIVPYQETRDPITPQSLLPVRLSEPQVRDIVKRWYATRWFAPDRLKSAALTDTLRGMYLPYWTFDAQAHADWTAESGDYYYETVTRSDSKGRHYQDRVRKIRWYHSSGSIDHFFDDELVPGSAGVRPDLLRRIEPFPTRQLVAYDPAFIRGWTVERYQIDLRRASQLSVQQMEQKLRELCQQQVPGDTHRNLNVDCYFSGRTFKHILVPVWLVTYSFAGRNYQVAVNGYTGSIAGDRPVSWVKVLLYVIVPLLIVLIVLAVARLR